MTAPTNGQLRRPIKIGSAGGAWMDPGYKMLEAAEAGVDAIISDSLAELNIGQNATATREGTHPGYEQNALDGFECSLNKIDEKRIKVVVNGGSMRPRALAEKVMELIKERGLNLKVAYTAGDDIYDTVHEVLASPLRHLDSSNANVKLAKDAEGFLNNPDKPITSANAYCGARAIVAGLRAGADIIICGRVSDASLTIGLAWWWHDWVDSAYDELAGALVAGHLIECSAYTTGGNFSGFDRYETESLVDVAFPICELDHKGHAVITKDPKLKGYVTAATVKTQLLYEIQGTDYLNSDVKGDIRNIQIKQEGPESDNRVRVTGATGRPPPPTTKLAIFYHGGWQAEFRLEVVGINTQKKFDLQEAQIRATLRRWGVDDLEVLEFQRYGVHQHNPTSQLAATTSMRVFTQSTNKESVGKVVKALSTAWMGHSPGMAATFDFRTGVPINFIAYFPALIEQDKLNETVTVCHGEDDKSWETIPAGHPSKYEKLGPRDDFETQNPKDLASFGPTENRLLGELVQGRSGDKGGNINAGFFIESETAETWDWLRSFFTKERMRMLIGDDWNPDMHWLERVELPVVKAVHFVWYGPLGRGTSSTARPDNLGKAFAEYIRSKEVAIPRKFLSSR